ncbi:hypothetical protein Goklo_023455 [Gossypium klotzschianum]|uniref:Uncharacterized protein n=1 Tax=Gossypium klotzschianum TaxID=34286 RepID=A0A7J8TQQ8_9ROSI|nr:hypothetical protein [Gossypium klotzschianum]
MLLIFGLEKVMKGVAKVSTQTQVFGHYGFRWSGKNFTQFRYTK